MITVISRTTPNFSLKNNNKFSTFHFIISKIKKKEQIFSFEKINQNNLIEAVRWESVSQMEGVAVDGSVGYFLTYPTEPTAYFSD